jgi:radical SAM protein with 4Fe4S-binding SPASM domain
VVVRAESPRVDRARADALVEQALAASPILREDKKRNVRRKAQDLAQGRLVWESGPLRLQIEPNRRCQLRCRHCDIVHFPKSELPLELLRRSFDELGDGVIELMPYVGGEPTLAPLEEIAELAREHGSYLNFTTNGVLFDRRLAERIIDACGRIIFSFHSFEPEVMGFIAPGIDHRKLVANMRACVEVAAPLGVPVLAGTCLMDVNIERLAEHFRFIAELGIRQVSFTKLHPNTAERETLDVYGRRSPGEIEHLVGRAMEAAIECGVFVETNVPEGYYTRYPENTKRVPSPYEVLSEVNALPSLYRPGFCPLLSNSMTVEHDGSVIACVRARMVLGNLHEESLAAIWNGARMQALRRAFLERDLYRECFGCMNFYSDTLHPSVPPIRDSGVWFGDGRHLERS